MGHGARVKVNRKRRRDYSERMSTGTQLPEIPVSVPTGIVCFPLVTLDPCPMTR